MEISYSASIMRAEQLKSVLKYNIKRVYIPFDLFFWELFDVKTIDTIRGKNIDIYISMPRIVREKDEDYLEALKKFLLLGKVDGLLVRNLESLGFVDSIAGDLESEYISINGNIKGYTTLMIETDYTLYNWNKSALDFMKNVSVNQTVPMELSIHEIKELEDKELVFPIYGRAPLMVTANCVKKTTGNCMADCTHGSFDWRLNDRKSKQFLVYANCIHCYNEIYNSVPTSLHKYMYDILKAGFNNFRVDFTDENNSMIEGILSYYLIDDRKGAFAVSDYTAGHISKGAI